MGLRLKEVLLCYGKGIQPVIVSINDDGNRWNRRVRRDGRGDFGPLIESLYSS